jgi:hypothetical protein
MADDKDLLLISSPEETERWPNPPHYEALWPVSKITAELEALITFRGHDALSVVNYGEVVKLVCHIVDDYNKALSEAQFKAWQFEGLLKGRANGR